MEKARFVAYTAQRQQIRDFLERATDTGGVLLVSGSRGLGKTRLVDEALNRRNILHKPGWFAQFFGDVSDSKRLCVNRQPNKVDRHIIKIDVDPYFPYFPPDNNAEPDENVLAVELIRNIVVALTSVLDCRCHQRKYGKTLTAKLGFWKYWFSHNALLWRANDQVFFWVVLLPLLALLFYAYGSFAGLLTDNFVVVLKSLIVSPFIAWVLLRWRDWRALHKMSEKLYALVHAQTSGEQRMQSEESKHNKLLIPVLLLCLVAILLPETRMLLDSLPLNASAGTLQGGLAVLFALGVVWVSSRSSQKHAEYSQDNPVWMITLLKRYLYLCHRCGLEPVLVFDELDKLEDMRHWWQEAHAIDSRNSLVRQEPQPSDSKASYHPEKLNQFLLTMARLKSSLGAEFLWVLIGGSSVYSRLQRDRHRRSDGTLGLLATTIQQEVILEPISFKDVNELQLFEKNPNKVKLEKTEPEKTELEKTLWLRSYGNLATLLRNHEKQHYAYNQKTAQLADKLIEIWPIEMQLDYLGITNDETWLEKLHDAWVQSWIHAGMLVAANDILKKPMTHSEMRNLHYEHWPKDLLGEPSEIEIHPAVVILQSEDANLLMALGKKLLFSYLIDQNYLSQTSDTGARKQYIELKFAAQSEGGH